MYGMQTLITGRRSGYNKINFRGKQITAARKGCCIMKEELIHQEHIANLSEYALNKWDAK